MNPLFFIPFDINDIPVVKQKFYKVKPLKEKKAKSVQIAKRYNGYLR